jgi:hypothetical protein
LFFESFGAGLDRYAVLVWNQFKRRSTHINNMPANQLHIHIQVTKTVLATHPEIVLAMKRNTHPGSAIEYRPPK